MRQGQADISSLMLGKDLEAKGQNVCKDVDLARAPRFFEQRYIGERARRLTGTQLCLELIDLKGYLVGL